MMTESETEDETLQRLETALRRIADFSTAPRPALHPSVADPASNESALAGIDRAALANTLDLLIGRLRAGLNTTTPSPLQPE